MFDIQAIAKNRQHFDKYIYIKSYQKFAVSKIRRTFAFGNGNETETEKKLFDNIDSVKAGFDSYRFLGLYAVFLMLYKNGYKGLTLAPARQAKQCI